MRELIAFGVSCGIMGAVAFVFWLVAFKEAYTAAGRARWAQERQDNRRVAQYVRLGMTPSSAEQLVADERARESAAVAMIVRDTEAAR